MDYNLTRLERETIVTFNEQEGHAELYSCSQPVIRMMDKLCAEFPQFSVMKTDEISKTYKFPKKYFKVRKPSSREGQKPKFLNSEGDDND
jgi:hypothetical protein